LVSKRIRKFAIGTAITGGVLVGIILLSRRFQVGSTIVEGFAGLGRTITGGPLALIEEFAKGAGQIGEEAKKISENFQRSLSGGLLASEQALFGGGGFQGGTVTEESLTTQVGQNIPTFLSNAFKAFEPDLTRDTEKAPTSRVLEVAPLFTFGAQAKRIQTQVTNAEQPNNKTTPFGGFDSSQAQETEFQKQLAITRSKFPQFFKLPDTGKQ